MKKIVFLVTFLPLLLLFISYPLQAQDSTPRLQLEKTVFSSNEPISFRYEGIPAPLTIILRNSQNKEIYFKATLQVRNNLQYVDIVPVPSFTPGTYSLTVQKDNYTLIDTKVLWGVVEKPPEAKYDLRRTTSKEIVPNSTTTITLTFTPKENIEDVELVDYVPYNAVINTPNVQVRKDPSLMHLQRPYDGDFEKSLDFGQVDPLEHFDIPFHDGVDFALPPDTPIIAADDAEVIPYREVNHYGITLALQHAWGQTYYGHLSTASAQIGQKVKKGDIIGHSGNTGLSSGPHLHFGLKWQETFVDPLSFISPSLTSQSSQKEVRFLISATKDIPFTFTYSYLLPAVETTSDAEYAFGPARITPPNSQDDFIAQEEGPTYVKLIENTGNNISFDNFSVIYDPTSHQLRGLDHLTNTTFTQAIDPQGENYLTLDNKTYLIKIIDYQTLTLTPSL